MAAGRFVSDKANSVAQPAHKHSRFLIQQTLANEMSDYECSFFMRSGSVEANEQYSKTNRTFTISFHVLVA